MSKNLIVIKKEKNNQNIFNECHKCNDWPMLAETHNLDKETGEYFKDYIVNEILREDSKLTENFRLDCESSINFFNAIEVPENVKIKLKMAPGCLICHSDLIPLKVHYALIKGYCDIKTVQYFLFMRGIYFKEWYLKKHLAHISIVEQKVRIKRGVSDLEIMNQQIAQINHRLEQLDEDGQNRNWTEEKVLRDNLTKIMTMKSVFEENKQNKGEGKKTIAFHDLMKQLKGKTKDL